MRHVIIINGYGRVGKDTFVDLFTGIIKNGGVANISTVDYAKDISRLMGWNGKTKTEKDRQLWSTLKKAMTVYNDGVFNNIINEIDAYRHKYTFVHCREPEEIQKFVDHYANVSDIACTTLLITNKRITPPNNSSDLSVINYKYDYTIANDTNINALNVAAVLYKSYMLHKNK
jgi:hypothetical protein